MSDRIKVMCGVARLGFGGTETQLYELLKRIDRERFECSVFTMVGGGEFEPKFRELGLPMDLVDRSSKYDPGIPFRTAQIIKKRNPDIVYTLTLPANFWGRVGALMARTPIVVASMRAVLRHSSRSTFIPERLMAPFCDLVIVNSPVVEQEYSGASGVPRKKIVVVPNGIDREKFYPGEEPGIRAELGVAPGELLLGTVSRLYPKKGFSYFMAAAAELLKKNDNLKVVVVGDGPVRASMEEKARELGLAHRITFAGFRPDVQRMMRAMDVMVFPSLSEGMPNVLAEGMASGLAVVACELEENRFVAENEVTALLVPPRNHTAMAEAVQRLLGDAEMRKRIGEAARKEVTARFNYNTMVSDHQEIFERLVKEKKKS